MLERATACIKAGARDSLKCAQQPPRSSTRRLHQTFWTHGAGDLDLLPPYAICSTPPTDLPLRHDDTRPAPRKHRTHESTSTATEGIFLDFLYPPQALAYLHRNGRQQFESWEKRNARRLPDGFVQASRGFSSRSCSRFAVKENAAKLNADERLQSGEKGHDSSKDNVSLGDVEDDSERNARSRRGADPAQNLVNELGFGRVAETGKDNIGAEASSEEEFDADFASSAGDVAEENMLSSSKSRDSFESTLSQDIVNDLHDPEARLRHLRQILNNPKRNAITPDHIRMAWRLYLSLPDVDKRDARLKEKLLVWLDEREHELADAHIISLYWSQPVDTRTLSTYQTVANSFLRRRDFAMLHAMHKEALVNIPNGQEISLRLFEMGLKGRNWNLIQGVVREHDSILTRNDRAHHIELFWAKVQGIPDLIDLASPPVKKTKSSGEKRRVRHLNVRLSREAVQQATDALLVKKLSNARLDRTFSLLRYIKEHDPEAHHFFHTLLTRLIPRLGQHVNEHRRPGSAALREDAHGIISFLYWHYRESKAARLHPDLMLIWLKHLTNRMETTNIEQRSERNVTANMVIADWQPWHAQLSIEAVHNLIEYSARAGAVEALGRWTAYLARRYPAYQEQQKVFWTQIYVHARLSDLPAAKKAFLDVRRSARAHGARPDLRCWNVLLQAYEKADDLDGAVETFQELITTTDLTPNHISFQPFVTMLARRGDVDAIEDILRQYDALTQEKRLTAFVNMQLRALNYLDDVPRAESLLMEARDKVYRGEIIGGLTDCYNSMLAKYASERDMNAVTMTYRRMKEWNIYRNETTYRHLMQALVNIRRTSAAWTILKNQMKADGFEPTAAHYLVAMSGFSNTDEPEKAIMVHNHMLDANVRQSVATKAALTKANALVERKEALSRARSSGADHADPLADALTHLRETVNNMQARDMTNTGMYSVQDTFSPVMWLLGGERNLEAVQQLFQDSKDVAERHGRSRWPTFALSTALMNAMYYAKEYTQVEAYWKVTKDQADTITPLTTIPDFVALREESQNKKLAKPTSTHKPVSAHADDRAEVGFVNSDKTKAAQIYTAPAESHATHLGPRPAPARRSVLARPFKIYLATLAAQNRIPDAIKEATRLLTQGYTFDNITWNRLIEYIAGSNPPLALLSFTLTERYLIRNFPGWTRRHNHQYPLRKSAKVFGLQYIRARYLAKKELMPQYRTFIYLAKALLEVQRREAVGWKGDNAGNTIDPTLQRFIGTVKDIREKAPRTLKFVQLMPRIDDKWQNRLLRGIGWKFPPNSNGLRVVGDAALGESNVVDAKLTVALSAEDAAFLADAGVDVNAKVVDENVSEGANQPASFLEALEVHAELEDREFEESDETDDAGVVIDDDDLQVESERR